MTFSTFVPTTIAVIRVLKAAALAVVSTDPTQAFRLALLVSLLRERAPSALPSGRVA